MRLIALLLAAVTGLAACGDGAGPADVTAGGPKAFETVAAGDPLPEAELGLLGADGTVSTADWRGKPTILNFWATWCAFCVEEMPELEAAHQQLGEAVRFVGVDEQDPNEEHALELAEETGVTYELVTDPDRSYFQAVKGRGMPLTVLVDADGVIRHRHNGPLTADKLLDLIDEHLDL